MRLGDAAESSRGFAKVLRDATEDKRSEEATAAAAESVARVNAELEARVEERTHALVERTKELHQMGALRQELLRKVVSAQEEERGRISRDLHDDTGQIVTALLLGLENLKNVVRQTSASDADVVERFGFLQMLAGEVAQKSHRLSFTLRPTDLDDIGLMGALHNYADQWSRWSGLPVEVDSAGLGKDEGPESRRLPPEVETTIYRVAQEGLTNVLRHALPWDEAAASGDLSASVTATSADSKQWASRVSILVQLRQRKDQPGQEVITTIEDDGPGFDVEATLSLPPGERRLGLFGMQERARLVGGTLTIESEPGRGTTVFLRLPIPQNSGPEKS